MQQLFVGIILVIGGITIMVKPIFYSSTYSMTFNFSSVKYPLSMVFLAVGAFCIYGSLKKKIKPRADNWICPKCEDVQMIVEEENYCSKCGIPRERLQGFYDRHSKE